MITRKDIKEFLKELILLIILFVVFIPIITICVLFTVSVTKDIVEYLGVTTQPFIECNVKKEKSDRSLAPHLGRQGDEQSE